MLRVTETGTLLQLRDNGIGFDTAASYPGHLGLISMQERAEALDGTFFIRSLPGSGTTVRVILPASNNTKAA